MLLFKWDVKIITLNNKRAKSWSINATPYSYPRILKRKTKHTAMPITRQKKKFNSI